MENIKSIKDLKRRALDLRDKGSSLVLLSLEYKLYLEIDFYRQLTVVNNYADIDKAYLTSVLHCLLVNNGKIDIISTHSENVELLRVIRHPDGISYTNTDRVLLYFIDRGNLMQEREEDILYKILAHRRTAVMFARKNEKGRHSFLTHLTTLGFKQVKGINCFFIK